MLIDSALGQWLPDLPDYNNPGVTTAYNVVPTVGAMQGAVTYQPMKAASLYSATTMASRPLGSAIGKDKLGNAKVYGGCATRLYKINSSNRTWQDISRAALYSTADGERWESTEYGNGIYLTNYSNEIQYINKDVDTQFANATSLVQARHIATVKDFIVVANTYDPLDGAVPYRVRWSGLGLPLSWDFSQATGADFQDVYGYGAVQAVVGGEAGWLIMSDGIVKMTYVEYPYWFRFDPIPNSKGCAVAQSVITVEGTTYFIGNDGFYAMDGRSGATVPIGSGKIDQFFLNSADTGAYQFMTVAVDPRAKLIYWSYVSADATDGTPDKMLVFNYLTGAWSIADATADYIFNSLSLSWTIEQLDTFGTIAQVPASFDSPLWAGGNAMLWAMKSNGAIYVFGGDTLPARIETGEQWIAGTLKAMDPRAGNGDRSIVSAVRPLFDGSGADVDVAVGMRSLSNDAVVWTDAADMHGQTGFAYFRTHSRYFRFRLSLSAGWSDAMGLQIEASMAGGR